MPTRKANAEQLHQLTRSNKDLREGLHENGNVADLAPTEAVDPKRDGSMSAVNKKE